MARFGRWVSVVTGVLALTAGVVPTAVAAPPAAAPDDDLAEGTTRAGLALRIPRPRRASPLINRGYAPRADADTGQPVAAGRLGRPPTGTVTLNLRYRVSWWDVPQRTVWPFR